jgi:Leucine-rich repeat (LRR) protein
MRKFYLLMICLFIICNGNAQIVNIPDSNFKGRLLAASPTSSIAQNAAGVKIKIDINNDSEIQVTEAALVYKLLVPLSNISDLTGLESFSNLTYLNCFNNQLTTLNVSMLTNLQTLNCYNNQLTSINLTGLSNLTSLFCYNNQLSTINVSSLVNMTGFDCSTNQLTTLNLTGLSQIRTFLCTTNNLTNLDVSNQVQMTYINCSSNQITNLNLQNNTLLKTIYCKSNQLTSLNLMNHHSLILIECDSNQLTDLQIATPNNLLNRLTCPFNQLTTINNLNTFTGLTYLNCSSNPLTSFPISNLINLEWLIINTLSSSVFPLNNTNGSNFTHLESLYFGFSDTQSVAGVNFNFGLLPVLTYLNCGSGHLSALNLSSPTLATLRVSFNQLTTLDLSNLPNLQELEFWSNPLDTIIYNYNAPLTTFYGGSNSNITTFDLSQFDLLTNISLSGNSNLTSFNIKNGMDTMLCYFTNCPNLQYICADDYEVGFIQDTINSYNYTNCVVNTYCNFNPGGTFYTIQGNNRLDINNNSCDTSDPILPNLKFGIDNGLTTGSLFSNASGSYSVSIPEGIYTITPEFENPSYFSVSPSLLNVTFPAQNSPYSQNFCIIPNGNHNDLEVIILPLTDARPGFDSSYKILYKNKGTNTQSGNLTLTFEDNKMDVISSSTIPTSQSTNILSWNYNNLLPMETKSINVVFNINSPVETSPVSIGDQLNFTAHITPVVGDEIIIDNTNELKQIVVGSLDPNDKTCIEGTVVGPTTIGEYVHYIIRFENTGTYAAQNVIIKDLINTSKFDINSLIPMGGSHSFITRITNTNQVEFIFENINLPFNDANNDGYVAFKIKTKPTLVVGDTFSNTASIYFDYNAPVVTNTATTTIQTLANPDFDFNNYFTLTPNPAKETLNINTSESIQISSVSIYNTIGQLILVTTTPSDTIDVTSLKTGSYFIKVISDKGTSSSKFLKE